MASSNRRKAVICGSVVLLHGAVLWAVQGGLLARVVEVVVPVQLVAISPLQEPAPKSLSEPLKPGGRAVAPQAQTRPVPQAVPANPPVKLPVPVSGGVTGNTPVLAAVADAAPSPSAPAGLAAPSAGAPSAVTPAGASTGGAGASGAGGAAARVELPSSDADYLHNPKPEYPRLSRQRNEQGKVVVNVFIGADGLAQKAEVKVSSGFERLDAAALATVRAWRYVPGKRGGVPEAMWFAVPINFVME